MSVVYWIHLKEHQNYFSEGYIGVTNDGPRRLKEHLTSYQRNGHFKHALKKYGRDNLIYNVILEGPEEYCYEIEKKLRPTLNVGWNMAIGGEKGGGYVPSEDTLKKISISLKGRKLSEEHRKNVSKYHVGMKGQKLSEEAKEKIRQSKLGKKRKPFTEEHKAKLRNILIKFNPKLSKENILANPQQ